MPFGHNIEGRKGLIFSKPAALKLILKTRNIEDFIREPFRLSACPAIIFHSISNLKLVQ